MCDFVLSPITYLEETTGAALKIRVNNYDFWVPAQWNILATDTETYQLDTVTIQSCATVNHSVIAFSPDEMKINYLTVTVMDMAEEMSLVHPMINKGTSLIHPVGFSETFRNKSDILAIVIGPFDLYKNLSNKVIGDLYT